MARGTVNGWFRRRRQESGDGFVGRIERETAAIALRVATNNARLEELQGRAEPQYGGIGEGAL